MTENRRSTINRLNIIISLVIAFAAWVYVVYNFAPMKEVTYYNVPIDYVGEETLEYRGYQLEEALEKKIDVTLKIRRIDFTKISEDSIEVRADVSEAVEGNNGISLEVIPPEESYAVSTSTKSVSVKVGQFSTDKEKDNESSNSK